MSYSLKIRVHDGKIVNSVITGELPDGQFDINGHVGGEWQSIAIYQRNSDNRYVIGAQQATIGQPWDGMLEVSEEAKDSEHAAISPSAGMYG